MSRERCVGGRWHAVDNRSHREEQHDAAVQRSGRHLAAYSVRVAASTFTRKEVTGTVAASGKRGRSAISGRFVKQSTVKRSPKTTVNESAKKK